VGVGHRLHYRRIVIARLDPKLQSACRVTSLGRVGNQVLRRADQRLVVAAHHRTGGLVDQIDPAGTGQQQRLLFLLTNSAM